MLMNRSVFTAACQCVPRMGRGVLDTVHHRGESKRGLATRQVHRLQLPPRCEYPLKPLVVGMHRLNSKAAEPSSGPTTHASFVALSRFNATRRPKGARGHLPEPSMTAPGVEVFGEPVDYCGQIKDEEIRAGRLAVGASVWAERAVKVIEEGLVHTNVSPEAHRSPAGVLSVAATCARILRRARLTRSDGI